MKQKHITAMLKTCLAQAERSECPRAKFGTVFCSATGDEILATGYNGYLRGSTACCGGDHECVRSIERIKSGTRVEVGCVHSETNAIYNAARLGVSLTRAVAFVSGAPCLNCAKALIQVGISELHYLESTYPVADGVNLLTANGVMVFKHSLIDSELSHFVTSS